MEHNHAAHLSYDQQGHELPMANMHHGGQHNEHTINYDQQQQQVDSMPMMMMKMFFHFGFGDTLLFEGLIINSAWKLWLTSAAVFLAAILLEAIDYSRGYLSCQCASASERHASATSQTQLIDAGSTGAVRQEPNGGWSCCANANGPAELANGHSSGSVKQRSPYFPAQRGEHSPAMRLVQSSLHFVRTGLSLCLMLVAMTYNVCLIFPILLGSGFGFYIFYRPALDVKSVMCH